MTANKFILLLLVCPLSISFYSCQNGEEKTSEATIEHFGKYVYFDDNNVLHLNPNCSHLREGKDDDGHDIYAKHPVDTANFMIENSESFRVCARCVNDKGYECLLNINERNRPALAARKWLYDKFVEANYDMPDFDSFCRNLTEQDVRSECYKIAKEENWVILLETEDAFSQWLGYGNKKNKLGL